MKPIQLLFTGIAFQLITSAALANDVLCEPLWGSYSCTDVLSPSSFELSISKLEQNGSSGLLIQGGSKKIQITLDGKDVVQDDTRTIWRAASGACQENILRVSERVTNRSAGGQIKIANTFQAKGTTGKVISLDIERWQRANQSAPWSDLVPEKYICIRK